MEIGTLAATELEALLRSDGVYACLDVRERGEFAMAQIRATSPVSRGSLEYRVPVMVPDRRVPLVVCCDDGRRSAMAAATLWSMGYTDVKTLAGGLERWKAAGLPLRSGWGVHGKEYGERVAVSQAVPQMTAQELELRRQRGEDLLVVDVRTEEEYLRGHVPGTYHIPGGDLLRDVSRLPVGDQTTLVLSCAGRTRGILGAQLLREAAFDNVYALENGAMGWCLAGYELEFGPGREMKGEPNTHRGAAIQRTTQQLASKEQIRFLPFEKLRELRESKELYYLVDVRIPREFSQGHIPGSISLPAGQIALTHENFLAVRRAPVVVIADDDLRPVWAASLLQRLGFRQVLVATNALQEWTSAGCELEMGPSPAAVFGLDEAKKKVAGLTPEAFSQRPPHVALDVRSIGEYGFTHIPGTRWLARGRLELDIEAAVPDKSSTIVTICDTTVRSILAAATLRSLGYDQSQYLSGGLNEWRKRALPLEDGLEGTGVSAEQAQADFGHTVWRGALGKSREDMQNYLSWEIKLGHPA